MNMKNSVILLTVILALYSCTDEGIVQELSPPGRPDEGVVVPRKSSLVWLNGTGSEAKELADEMQRVNNYDQVLSFNDLPGTDKSATLTTWAADSLKDITVIANVADFMKGTYTNEMLQDIRHDNQGVILIAKDGNSNDVKSEMLTLFGIYVDKGYYRVSFPKEQYFDFYWKVDPDAKKKLCGIKTVNSSFTRGGTSDPSDPEVTNRAYHTLKRLRINNHMHIYTNHYDYRMTGYESLDPYEAQTEYFKPRSDKSYDAVVDREWIVDAYNLRVYSPTSGDNLLAVYNDGGAGFLNRMDSRYFMIENPPKNDVIGLIWGLRNNAYSKVSIREESTSALNLNLVHFAPGLPQSETGITHGFTRSIGFELGFKPELKGDFRWTKSITYQLMEMTREVSRNIGDTQMDYKWVWYPETLFQGSKAMKDDGMINGEAMVSPMWSEILWDQVGKPPVKNVFCDFNNDPGFNQNLLNYQQECAVITKTEGASAGLVAIDITDGVVLQLGGASFCGWGSEQKYPFPYSSTMHDLTVDVNRKTTVWIDYNNW